MAFSFSSSAALSCTLTFLFSSRPSFSVVFLFHQLKRLQKKTQQHQTQFFRPWPKKLSSFLPHMLTFCPESISNFLIDFSQVDDDESATVHGKVFICIVTQPRHLFSFISAHHSSFARARCLGASLTRPRFPVVSWPSWPLALNRK